MFIFNMANIKRQHLRDFKNPYIINKNFIQRWFEIKFRYNTLWDLITFVKVS
jgi:hypothetical protein